MRDDILLPRSTHAHAATHAAYVRDHARVIRERHRRGAQVAVHPVATPAAAEVNDQRWILRCACGGACSADPSWPDARCWTCGAVYTHIVWPDAPTRHAIADALAVRPLARLRSWEPQETVQDLHAENRRHGLPATSGGRA
jgi:hypothetical protein